ncbi:MAG: site-specific tyrosine recombinase XerC, partial [Phycisphaerales bacterium]|nr:site-specific tyrosine recombinase XerC [Phycisphaerales bacterium]
MPRTPTVPSYRLHAPTGKAVVTLDGRDLYLGPHGSPESRARYDRSVQEWLANGRRLPPAPSAAPAEVSVAELLEAYWREAERWYTKGGRATSHAHNVRDAMAPVLRLYGLEPVGAFGPLALKAVRELFVGRGLCRSTVNKHVGTVRRNFKWGTENELVPATVYHALQAVSGLRRGRSAAREGEPVRPVPQAFVDAVLPHVSRQVAATIRLQEVTGMRPGEAVVMRGRDLDTAGNVWTYTPATHKTEHHGIERPIYLGPRAQDVLRPFLKPDLIAYLFDPRDAEADRHAVRRATRRTPMTPSQAKR